MKHRILYIDDDPGLTRLMKKRLERQGFQVDTAERATLGIEMATNHNYALLLLDYDLPDHNGLAVIKTLARRSIHLPVIMVTGRGNEEVAVEIMKLGPNDYIVKDVEGEYFKLLPAMIENLLEKSLLRHQKEVAEKALLLSEEKFRIIADFAHDWEEWLAGDGTYEYISPSCERISGYSPEEFYRRPGLLFEIVVPEDKKEFKDYLQTSLSQAGTLHPEIEFRIRCKNQEQRWIASTSQAVATEDGRWLGCRTSHRDITKRKEAEEQLLLLSFHDSLTGLYNRNYYEQELLRLQDGRHLPLGLIIYDIDGLKMINDTLGHQCGDELIKHAAKILKDIFRDGDMIARTGGDEFVVLLPDCDPCIFHSAARRIKANMPLPGGNSLSSCPISLSIGAALATEAPLNLQGLYKKADDLMYQDKQAHRSTFRTRVFRFMEHMYHNYKKNVSATQKMVLDYALLVGGATLTRPQLKHLELLARYYDIGNIGVAATIFTNPGRLSEDEQKQMHLHCEIGSRIANFFPELTPISHNILIHHQHWDGKGYPPSDGQQPLPLINAILSVVVAYCSMITECPYRVRLTPLEAQAELHRCRGSEFNPDVVDLLIKLLAAEGARY